VTSDTADLSSIANNLGGDIADNNPAAFQIPAYPLVTVLVHTESQVDARILQSCDALVVALDGASGVGAKAIEVWELAKDLTLPRHILAFNVVHGRADFDELCAIASRTMEPDLMVRYLPIDSDDELSLTGVYDILTSEIHAIVESAWITQPADPEHIALTSSAREDLFEQLAYLGLDDATLQNHQSGLPISVTKLESAWSHPDLVAITPIDDGVGAQIFGAWLNLLNPVWVPTQVQGELAIDVTQTSEYVGVAITEELARMWGEAADHKIGQRTSSGWKLSQVVFKQPGLIWSQGFIPGGTICLETSASSLVAPIF
jgi:hypothetical protein